MKSVECVWFMIFLSILYFLSIELDSEMLALLWFLLRNSLLFWMLATALFWSILEPLALTGAVPIEALQAMIVFGIHMCCVKFSFSFWRTPVGMTAFLTSAVLYIIE